jgi:hypothetical protein
MPPNVGVQPPPKAVGCDALLALVLVHGKVTFSHVASLAKCLKILYSRFTALAPRHDVINLQDHPGLNGWRSSTRAASESVAPIHKESKAPSRVARGTVPFGLTG